MGMVVGGRTAWKVLTFHDIGVAYHWLEGEPAMVLFPRYRHLRLVKAIPWAIKLPELHQLVRAGTKGFGVDSAVLLEKAADAANVMGLGQDYATLRNIADAILHGIDDLVNMPPEPDWHEKEVAPTPEGEIAVKVDGKTIAAHET